MRQVQCLQATLSWLCSSCSRICLPLVPSTTIHCYTIPTLRYFRQTTPPTFPSAFPRTGDDFMVKNSTDDHRKIRNWYVFLPCSLELSYYDHSEIPGKSFLRKSKNSSRLIVKELDTRNHEATFSQMKYIHICIKIIYRYIHVFHV